MNRAGVDVRNHGGLASEKAGGDGNPCAPAVPNGGEGGTVAARRGDGQSGGCFSSFLQGVALEARKKKLPGATCQIGELRPLKWSTGVTRRERDGQGRRNLAKFGQIELEFEFHARGLLGVRHNVSTKHLFFFLKLLMAKSCSLSY